MTCNDRRPAGESVFDLADRDLRVGDVFRWPCGAGARSWRITAVVDPEVDDLMQRVRAVPARVEIARCRTGPAGGERP